MSINAMNALHQQLPGEDPLVAHLVRESGHVPRWGADSEDSKTPMARDLRMASRNLKGCFDGTLSYDDPRNGKHYSLAEDGLALPVKRIPGLALPAGPPPRQRAAPSSGRAGPAHLDQSNREEARVLYFPKLRTRKKPTISRRPSRRPRSAR